MEHLHSAEKKKTSADLRLEIAGQCPDHSDLKAANHKSPISYDDQVMITPELTTESVYQDHEFWWQRARVHVALLGLAIGAVNCYAQATFCIAIVEMVLPPGYQSNSHDGHQPATSIVAATNANAPDASDLSCPYEDKYHDYYDSRRLATMFPVSPVRVLGSLVANETGHNRPQLSRDSLENRFDWSASQQGILLGAFAVGMAPLQIAGGRLAEIYGARWVLLVCALGTAITNLTMPYIAHWSFLLLVANRVVMGVAQAGMEPGLMCLLSDWLTPEETGFFISMLLFAMCIGFFLGSLGSSFVLALDHGWPVAFYVSGGLNLLIALVWLFYADSWPRSSKYINHTELKYIEHHQGRRNQQHTQTKTDLTPQESKRNTDSQLQSKSSAQISTRPQTPAAPWRNILTTPSVWAFIICKISIRWCADVIANDLPTYLANVLHLSIKINGILNSISSALFAIFSFFAGWLVNEIIMKKYPDMNKTTLRKVTQSTSNFSSAFAIFFMTYYDCDIFVSMSMLLLVSCSMVFACGGELQIPYDMTSKYPGTLHGMACTLSVSGWLAPPLIGLILGNEPSSRYRWHIVWYSTAFITFLGGVVFVLLADASPQDFDKRRDKQTSKRDKDQLHHDNSPPDKGIYLNRLSMRLDKNCEATEPPIGAH